MPPKLPRTSRRKPRPKKTFHERKKERKEKARVSSIRSSSFYALDARVNLWFTGWLVKRIGSHGKMCKPAVFRAELKKLLGPGHTNYVNWKTRQYGKGYEAWRRGRGKQSFK